MSDASNSKSKQPQSESDDGEKSILSSVASSAASLLGSITRPPPSSAASALDSASASKSHAGSSRAGGGPSSSWSETVLGPGRIGGQSYSGQGYGDFRGRGSDADTSVAAAEGDYTCFAAGGGEGGGPFQISELRSRGAHSQPQHSQPDDGADAAALLSFPLSTSEVYTDDLLETADTRHPVVAPFVECEDPVDFLAARPERSNYTDSVWGDLLGVLRIAEKEIEADRGKGKEVDGKAVERFKQTWGQPRAKL